MIKTIFLAFLLVPVVLALENDIVNWQSLGGIQGTPPYLDVIEVDQGSMVLDITIPGFYMYEYPSGGFIFNRIVLPGYYNQNEIGLPELPAITSLFAMPFGAKTEISIEQIEVSEFSGINVLPTQEPEIDMPHTPFPFRINEDYYASDRVFPSDRVIVDNEGIWAGVRVARIMVNPFSYNPETGTLSAVRSIRVRINFIGATAEKFRIHSERLSMFRNTLLNFNSLEYLFDTAGSFSDETDTAAELIVIANADNIDDVEDLIELHNSIGLETVVEILSNPATVDAIESAINDNYDSAVTRFALIVGDNVAMPLYSYGDYLSDYYYTLIEGGDNYPEIAIGRLTGNETQIAHQVDKIINGYMSYNFSDASDTIVAETVLAAHEQDYPNKYTQCCNEIAAYNYNSTMNFTKVYPPEGGTAADVSTAINNGVGTVGYRGHGSITAWTWSPGWTKTNINALTNTFMPHVFNIACYCGRLQSGECLAESWQWADGGSSGNVAANKPSYTTANHDYMKQIYIALYDTGLLHIGEALNAAAEYIITNHGSSGLTNAKMYIWFGDPAVETWTVDAASNPLLLQVDLPDCDNSGVQTVDVTVVDRSGSPVSGVNVTITDGIRGYDVEAGIYREKITDASGQVSFSIDAPSSGILTVGAFKHGMRFDVKEIRFGGLVIEETEAGEPEAGFFGLMMPFPNPVTATASISFNLASGGNIELAVFDIMGRKVDIISSGEMPAGTHNLVWQLDNIPSGVYFMRLTSGAETATRQVMVIR